MDVDIRNDSIYALQFKSKENDKMQIFSPVDFYLRNYSNTKIFANYKKCAASINIYMSVQKLSAMRLLLLEIIHLVPVELLTRSWHNEPEPVSSEFSRLRAEIVQFYS